MSVNNQVRADIELHLKKVNVSEAKTDIMGEVRNKISSEATKILEKGIIPTKGPGGEIYKNFKTYSEDVLKSLEQIEKSPTYKRAQSILKTINTGGLSPEQMKFEARKLNTVLSQLGREGWQNLPGKYTSWDPGNPENLRKAFSGLGNKRAGKTGIELLDLIQELPGTLEKTTDEFRISLDKFGKNVETSGRKAGFRISYIASAINMGLSVARSVADYAKIQETTFDLSSPQGMGSALMSREMAIRSLTYSNTGKVIGQLGGALLGQALIPIPVAGAFMGSYIGGNIGGTIGDIAATVKNIPTQKQQALFNGMWGWAGRNEQSLEQLQGSTYHAAGRMGWRVSPDTMLKLFGSEGTGLNLAQQAQYAEGLVGARGEINGPEIQQAIRLMVRDKLALGEGVTLQKFGRLTGGMAFGEIGILKRLAKRIGLPGYQELIPALGGIGEQAARFVGPGGIGEATGLAMNLPGMLFPGNKTFGNIATAEGQQTLGAFNALVSPTDQAQTALLFAAYKKANPKATPMDIMFRIKQGIYGKNNLTDLISSLPKDASMRKMMIQSILLQNDVTNPDIANAITDKLGSASYGKFNEQLNGTAEGFNKGLSALGSVSLKDLANKVTPGETKAAELFASAADSAKKIQESFLNMEVEWQKAQNTMIGNGSLLTSMYKDSLERMWEIYKDVMGDTNSKEMREKVTAIEQGNREDWTEAMKKDREARAAGPMGTESTDHVITTPSGIVVRAHTTYTVEDTSGAKPLKGTGRTRK